MKKAINLAELVENSPNNATVELEPGRYILNRKIDLSTGKSIKSKKKWKAVILVDFFMKGNVWDWFAGDNTPGQFVDDCWFEYTSGVIL